MTPERERRIDDLFYSALEREPAEREAFLRVGCAGDESLRREVESLLAAHEKVGDFIEEPAAADAGRILADRRVRSMLGRRMGHYTIVGTLGAGGMGEVYLAEDARLGRRAAIKLLPPALEAEPERLRRFEQEARAASALNHPNILTIYETGTDDGSLYIAAEYVEGVTLRERMNAGRLGVAEALDVAAQVADALSAAHAAGIVHRDVKPENVMLRSDGYVKVLDFGLAKLNEPAGGVAGGEGNAPAGGTEPGMVMGTARYMSPEQARGQKTDGRSDLWSLGVVLYEALTACPPFDGPTASDVLASVLKDEPAALGAHLPDVPAGLQEMLDRLFCKEPARRYQRAADMSRDLKRLRRRLDGGDAEGVQPTIGLGEASAEGGLGPGAAAGPHTTPRRARWTALVLAALLFTGVAAVAAALYFAGPTAKAVNSVAVLPFVNAGGSAETEYFSDGITEATINSLSRLPGLSVTAHSSVFRFKGRQVDPRAAAAELGVEAVLTGRVVEREGALEISAELVDARTNYQLWNGKYTRGLPDLPTVQAEIARDISEQLRPRLSSEEERRLAKSYTPDAEAYRLYLRGRYHWNKRTREDTRKSLEHFEAAIARDPGYALAYAGLADAYNVLPTLGAAKPAEALPRAQAAARRALEMDNTLAEAHTALAFAVQGHGWDFRGAEAEYRRAIELNPSYATARHWYSRLLLQTGKFDQAIAEAKRAHELDPLSPNISSHLARVYRDVGRYDEAAEQARKAIELDKNFANAHLVLSLTYEEMGRYEEAAREFGAAAALSGVPAELATRRAAELAEAHRRAGPPGYWRKRLNIMREDGERGYVSPTEVASLHARLGENEEALELLGRAYRERDALLVWLKTYPAFSGLRSDPRFQQLLARVGFEP